MSVYQSIIQQEKTGIDDQSPPEKMDTEEKNGTEPDEKIDNQSNMTMVDISVKKEKKKTKRKQRKKTPKYLKSLNKYQIMERNKEKNYSFNEKMFLYLPKKIESFLYSDDEETLCFSSYTSSSNSDNGSPGKSFYSAYGLHFVPEENIQISDLMVVHMKEFHNLLFEKLYKYNSI